MRLLGEMVGNHRITTVWRCGGPPRQGSKRGLRFCFLRFKGDWPGWWLTGGPERVPGGGERAIRPGTGLAPASNHGVGARLFDRLLQRLEIDWLGDVAVEAGAKAVFAIPVPGQSG